MAELIRILDKIMNDHFAKAVKRQEKRRDEDYDEVSTRSLLGWYAWAFRLHNPSIKTKSVIKFCWDQGSRMPEEGYASYYVL